MTIFSKTSALVQKLACYFFEQGFFVKEKLVYGDICWCKLLVKENLSYFPFTLLRETCQGKTCQGELASEYTVNKFFLTKGLVKENLLV